MDVEYIGGDYKAYLHDASCSVFANSEQEYLLGHTIWKVTKIEEETLVYKIRDNKNHVMSEKRFPCTVIYL